MAFEIFSKGTLLGSIVRSEGGNAYAFRPNGSAIGQYADFDAAARALMRLQQVPT
ncbi:hypothetical protein [Methylobacterium iners]|uniref:Uncharacterized protein n=1 Tax=Methylobacterium iners TaxID=418707 RepID=A0ABQ4S5B1_9HYPH|nr:hypothetical protein [Methylobacterium iners]GJD97582.1 hypothetical protein OCOJLMKI_4814 [Methylobacterium iners]